MKEIFRVRGRRRREQADKRSAKGGQRRESVKETNIERIKCRAGKERQEKR